VETFIIAQSQLGEESGRSEGEEEDEELDEKAIDKMGEDEWDF
jgi:hypothetical protein